MAITEGDTVGDMEATVVITRSAATSLSHLLPSSPIQITPISYQGRRDYCGRSIQAAEVHHKGRSMNSGTDQRGSK